MIKEFAKTMRRRLLYLNFQMSLIEHSLTMYQRFLN